MVIDTSPLLEEKRNHSAGLELCLKQYEYIAGERSKRGYDGINSLSPKLMD
jgi:hypothetical protein